MNLNSLNKPSISLFSACIDMDLCSFVAIFGCFKHTLEINLESSFDTTQFLQTAMKTKTKTKIKCQKSFSLYGYMCLYLIDVRLYSTLNNF